MTERPICIKCKEKPSDFTNRTEDMCSDCFLNFARLKCARQMADLKVDYSPRAEEHRVLLPLSFGKASLALLDMVCDLLERQKSRHNGRQGFILHALHIDDRSITDLETRLSEAKQRFPLCHFEVLLVDELPLQEAAISLINTESTTASDSDFNVDASGISEISNALASRSSKQDFDMITKRQIVDSYCRKNGFQTVIWGLCTTSLSELVISLTAKGRGPLIPDHINPATDRFPQIIYPVGDLLRSELEIYLDIKNIKHLAVPRPPIPATTKFQSIDELVAQYFASVEEGFPAVVSTVARTALKLESPLTQEDSGKCVLCGEHIQKGSAQWLEAITVHATKHLPENLCYGCLVMVQGSRLGHVQVPRYTSEEDVVNKYSI